MWKIVIVGLAAFFLWKMFMGDVKKRDQEVKKEQETLIAKGEMVKDPVCGSYVAVDNAVRMREGDRILHFCSYECRDTYMARIESSKTKEG